MDIKEEIRAKILSNHFTFQDYRAFNANLKLVKKHYHPDLTADFDLAEAIMQMAEDSIELAGVVILSAVMWFFMLFYQNAVATVFVAIFSVVIWSYARMRNLPLRTELRLIRLAFRMRKILKVRACKRKMACGFSPILNCGGFARQKKVKVAIAKKRSRQRV